MSVITKKRSNAHKYLLTGLTLSAVLAAARPAVLSKVYAANNTHQWTKQEDLDPLNGQYQSAAVSANGDHLIVATVDGGSETLEESPLFVSNNYGSTWENVASEIDEEVRNNWTGVDVTNDGQTMVAASRHGTNLSDDSGSNGKIFISEDAGDSWVNITPDDNEQWSAIAISGDGSRIVAAGGENTVAVSDDGGATWENNFVGDMIDIASVSIADDGSKVLATSYRWGWDSEIVAVSDDGGATWDDISPEFVEYIDHMSGAMSADGDKIAVSMHGFDGGENDVVLVSDNNGAEWDDVSPEDPGINYWTATALSDDGLTLGVTDEDHNMYLSSDSGANWNEEEPDETEEDTSSWRSLDLNSDGSRGIASSEAATYIIGESNPVQSTVSFPEAVGGKAVTLTTPEGTTITCHSAVKETGLTAQDGAFSYPLGFVDFCFSGADETNEITLVFETDLKPNQVIARKYNPNTNQYTTIAGATITETTYEGQHALRVVYNVADNGPLDMDPDDGEVADPVGLAVSEIAVPNTGVSPQESNASNIAALSAVTLSTGLLATFTRRKVFSRTSVKK